MKTQKWIPSKGHLHHVAYNGKIPEFGTLRISWESSSWFWLIKWGKLTFAYPFYKVMVKIKWDKIYEKC